MPELTELVLCLIENSLIFIFFNALIEKRFNSIIPIFAIVIINAYIVLVCNPLSVSLRSTIFALITIIGSCIAFKGAIHIKSALSVTLIFLFNTIDIISGLLLSLISDEHLFEILNMNTVPRFILCIIVKILDAAVVYAVYRLFSKQSLEASSKVWGLYCVVISTFLFVTLVFPELYQTAPQNSSLSALCLIASIVAFINGIITIAFFTYLCQGLTSEKRLNMLQNSYDVVQEQLAVQSENSEKISKIRHDAKNHLQTTKTLLEKGEYSAAESLIEDMIGETDNIHLEFRTLTGNEIIDAAIAVKSAICKKRNIDFKVSCDTLPELKISEIDLSSIMSNVLDNAISGTEKTAAPRIILKICVKGNYLNIASENSYCGKIKKSDKGKITTLVTTKCNSELHGFGTRILGELALKYDGTCVYKFEQGYFRMNVMLNYALEPSALKPVN